MVLYLHSDSIHHGYLNKTGKVTVKKFNLNMVGKALNVMLVRQQFGLPIILLILFNNNLIMTENKKFQNLKAHASEIRNSKCNLCKMSSVVTNNFLPECSLDIVG